ncbi:HEPN domain-containing protein [Marinifilum fragile]|uniref:HEPN domain-containing protein n=1 Tax=Marinifilum fragile TaxID=570161 RepID=UPI002AA6D42B|nr:HEPN domain-containing protein [Marinifilum fragile]
MNDINLKVIIPLLTESGSPDSECYSPNVKKTAKNNLLHALSMAELKLESVKDIKINLRTFKKKPRLLKRSPKSIESYELDNFLVFSLHGCVDYPGIIEALKKAKVTIVNGQEFMDLAKYVINNAVSNSFKNLIDENLILSHLSTPGVISIRTGAIFIDGEFYEEYKGISSLISEAYRESLVKKYPPVKFTVGKNVLDQLKRNKISFKANPSTPIEKALNCLSHVLNPSNDITEAMIYSVMGIETLYVTGNQNIQKQVDENVQIFLGKLKEHKKIIKELYNFRSKLLHGEYPLKPYHMYRNWLIDGFDEIDAKSYHAFTYSTMILVATLQKMILSDRTELIFRTELVN